MIDEIRRQTQDMLTAAAKLEIPAEIRNVAIESVTKAREASAKWNSATSNYAAAIEDTINVTQVGAKTLGTKMMSNAAANVEAAFDAAQQLAAAKSLAEVAQIQSKFAQDQLAIAAQQSKALLELSTAVAKQTADALQAIAAKAAEDLKKAT